MSELYHHGIKGQKWGVRRYQNKDGSLTELGKQRLRSRATDMSHLGWPRNKNRKDVVSDPAYANAKNSFDREKFIDDFFDRYAKATIKDLRLEATDESIRLAKEAIEKNESYAPLLGPRFTEAEKCINSVIINSSSISKDVSNAIISDIKRWNKENNTVNIPMSNKVQNAIREKIKRNIEEAMPESVVLHQPLDGKESDSSFVFVINGIKEYADYQPLEIEYDRKTNKVTRIDYA